MPEDNSHAGQGAVMLDIGGDIGALIVTMPAVMEGIEIEIRPIGGLAQTGDHDHDHDHEHVDHDHDHDHHDHGDHVHGQHGHLIHVAVVGRPAADGVHYSAVFGELPEGTYELYERPDGPVRLTASVTGGEVSSEVWPD